MRLSSRNNRKDEDVYSSKSLCPASRLKGVTTPETVILTFREVKT